MDVFPEGPIENVFLVQVNFVGKDHLSIVGLGIIDVRQNLFLMTVLQGGRAGDPRTHGQYDPILTLQAICETRYIGPRANKAHLSQQHVDQLWKLIDFGFSPKLSEGSDALIAGRGHRRPIAGQFRIRTITPRRSHSSDLQNFEQSSAASNTNLSEQPVGSGIDGGDHPSQPDDPEGSQQPYDS